MQNSPTSDTIYYQPQQKLTWSDFKGMPPPNHSGGAITASGYAYHAQIHHSDHSIKIDVTVICFFSKQNSWRRTGLQDAYHLEHEQHHFDITYLGAMQFINSVKHASFNSKNYNRLLNDIFDQSYSANNNLQNQYDKETRNSIDVKNQNIWNKKIDLMLSKQLTSAY